MRLENFPAQTSNWKGLFLEMAEEFGDQYEEQTA